MHLHVRMHAPGHRCQNRGCGTVLVLDGNQKNNRSVCAAEEAGYVEYAGLPGKVKTGCLKTPEQQSTFCPVHKPRHMQMETPDTQNPNAGHHGVVETILRKKQARNGTYYEVHVHSRVHVSFLSLSHVCGRV